MCIGKIKTPETPKPTAAAATVMDTTNSESVRLSRERERKRMAAAMSQLSTNPTGGQGVTGVAAIEKKKLLGE